MFHEPINSNINNGRDLALHIFTLRFFRVDTPTIVFYNNYERFVRNCMNSLSLL
jgi:hypothetical protein